MKILICDVPGVVLHETTSTLFSLLPAKGDHIILPTEGEYRVVSKVFILARSISPTLIITIQEVME